MENASELPPAIAQALESSQRAGGAVLGLLIGFGFMLVVSAIFSTLGGLLGAMLVARPAPASSIPPPPPTP